MRSALNGFRLLINRQHLEKCDPALQIVVFVTFLVQNGIHRGRKANTELAILHHRQHKAIILMHCNAGQASWTSKLAIDSSDFKFIFA
jgi:hypothetical protein